MSVSPGCMIGKSVLNGKAGTDVLGFPLGAICGSICSSLFNEEMTVSVENWAEQVRAGDVGGISRAGAAIENRSDEAEEILRQVFPYTGNAYLVGITGAPGTGKSTLVDR